MIYFQDDEALASAGASTGLGDAKALIADSEEMARAAKETADAAHDQLTNTQRGNAAIRQLVSDLRAGHDRETKPAFESTVLDHATADIDGYADQYARRVQKLSWYAAAIQYCDNTTLPRLLMQSRRADASMFREAGNAMMALALHAAIERHEAAKPLIETDGIAVISARGRAHDILMSALEMHRRAAEADAAADAEERRIKTLEGLK